MFLGILFLLPSIISKFRVHSLFEILFILFIQLRTPAVFHFFTQLKQRDTVSPLIIRSPPCNDDSSSSSFRKVQSTRRCINVLVQVVQCRHIQCTK